MSIVCSRGIELRAASASQSESIEFVSELVGKPIPNLKQLTRQRLLFEFPTSAVEVVPRNRSYVRRGRSALPLAVCRPPHIIVHKTTGRFAVYSDEFMVVPAGQFGIAGSKADADFLKAMSLYLISDFAIYHQFLNSPEWGVSTSVSTLNTLRMLPVPFVELSPQVLSQWAELHSRVIRAARKIPGRQSQLFDADEEPTSGKLSDLLREMNLAIFELLKLSEAERLLVTDLVRVRMQMLKGKVTAEIARDATIDELLEYGNVLLRELDAFIDDQPDFWHTVAILKGSQSAIVGITLNSGGSRRGKRVAIIKDDVANANLDGVGRLVHDKYSQWMYFRRNLRLYEGRNTYVFKPLERIHWIKSQAILDAGSVITETLT